MKIAVTGSSGYIGSAIGRRLQEDGHEVIGLRRGRSDDAAADWDPEAGWVRAGVLDGVDAIVHMTGVSIGAGRWTEERRRLLRSSRVDATRTLVQHLETLAERPRVLVSASAVGYYGHRGGERTLDEQSPRGDGYLAELVADWEAEAARAEALGVRTVLMRTAPVLARDSELMSRLLPPFRMGVGGTLGTGRQWFSWVTIDDVTEIAARAVVDDTLSGPVNVVAPEPVTNREFTRTLGRVLRRPTILPLPATALRLLFGRARAEETLLASQRVLPARLLASGYRFHHADLETALRSLLTATPPAPARPDGGAA